MVPACLDWALAHGQRRGRDGEVIERLTIVSRPRWPRF